MNKTLLYTGIGIALLLIIFLIAKKMKFSKLVTNFKIRPADKFGSGKFGSSRTHGKHEGMDILVDENQPIFAPDNLTLVRITRPYADDKNYLGGVYKDSLGNEMKIFYMNPINKKEFKTGEVIGKAQNITKKYGSAMNNHIHVEYREKGLLKNPELYV